MHDWLLQGIFYVFAGVAVLSALMVITQNNPVRCVLFLVVAFLASSVLWIMVHAEFLALILVLVYVGAVMTLFLFVVMMLNIDVESMKRRLIRYLPFGLILVALLVAFLIKAFPNERYQSDVQLQSSPIVDVSDKRHESSLMTGEMTSDTARLGLVLYTDYVFAFELAAVILLVAIISAISLVHRNPSRSKRQDIVGQIMTRRDDRVTLIPLKSEKS